MSTQTEALHANEQHVSTAVSARALLESYLDHAQHRPLKPLAAKSARQYRHIWLNWVLWITPPQQWDSASPADVSRYLNQLQPSAAARMKRQQQSVDGPSDVTMRRYWRVLHQIYAWGMLDGRITTNPCREAPDIPASEVVPSMILPGYALEQLRNGLLQSHQQGVEVPWRKLRDDALVLLLAETGLKVHEAIALRPEQVSAVRTDKRELQLVVQVERGKTHQKRQLLITHEGVVRLLLRWVNSHALVDNAPPELFFGAKTRQVQGRKICIPLTAKSAFVVVANALNTHLPLGTFGGALAHVGPETLRNSVLANWLASGINPEEVVRRAGLESARLLVRLDRTDALAA